LPKRDHDAPKQNGEHHCPCSSSRQRAGIPPRLSFCGKPTSACRYKSALARLRVTKREVGAGTRALLDQLLIATGIDPDDVKGPIFRSHLEIGLAVAAGIADVGLGVRAAANDLNLCFIPVTWEPYDIALSADALGAARPLLTTLRNPTVQASISKLGGYDLEPAGAVEALSDTPRIPNSLRVGSPLGVSSVDATHNVES
jgi:putative molybdopterin biosynthesis protein